MDINVSGDGWLTWTATGGHARRVRCAVGNGGVADKRHEGDGITPIGRWPLRQCHVRTDRLEIPQTGLALRPITEADGWCDDATSDDYNRLVTLPLDASHEAMWRADGLYDIVIEVGYNDDPVVPGRGSAIFMHIAKPYYAPTEGCVALNMADMLDLLRDCDATTLLLIG
ncbi:MAG: L,D-transpeptidase family protein [Rhodospirillaceae bacterium]|jgi:L,D-peptidoglycan transpeptidase YkuD (ErfK/YbiS/YcfS/YnhG family)|nr:L,D-transpeptidase family protein [Rhodospirillaceae bacterium]MBT4219063.1 L,D-transpeptidase family protein [Rhodospirillaceae bacterium]MBT5309402.1 L,D-transpeptidase family protein [Rhodospirillaceae bacterium]MBT6406488.1 L,D-transpeptidase family protein [Rhodospirillaceae bacterium]MBT7356583.1 L,D-transpeptidase family protein [Rhodospirillaceae bacterium]